MACSARLAMGRMQPHKGWLAGAEDGDAPSALSFWQVAALDPASPAGAADARGRAALQAACVRTCLALVQQQAELLERVAPGALEACMRPSCRALEAFAAQAAATRVLRKCAQQTLHTVHAAVRRTVASRAPPLCAELARKTAAKLLNPKFEVDYDKRRDYDPDRERAEYKQYKRLAAKEARGALPLPEPLCLCSAAPWDILIALGWSDAPFALHVVPEPLCVLCAQPLCVLSAALCALGTAPAAF
jgi:Nop14-like family